MENNEILENLCYYDKRNPNNIAYDVLNNNHCYCDNCFKGKTQLAEKILKLTEEFEQYKKESIKWNIEDFLEYEMDDGWHITKEQAQKALEHMIREHNFSEGITWDEIEYYYQEYGTYKE